MKNNLSEIRKIVRNVLSENLTLRDLTLSDLESVASPIKLRGGIDQLNVSLPNADVGSLTRIDLNSEFAQRNLDYYKDSLVDKLGDDSILDSTVTLNPEEVWFNKVVIDNEDLERKRRPSLEESDLRQTIRNVMEEAFWTDSDWSKYLVNDDGEKINQLKNKIVNHIESDEFKKSEAVDHIVNSLASGMYPDKNEYELVDLSKVALEELKYDLINKEVIEDILSDFDYMYQKVNEVVSAVADTPEDDQIDVQEGKKKSKKKKKKSRKPKDVGYPYVMSVPTGIIHSFDYGVSDAGSDGGGGGE